MYTYLITFHHFKVNEINHRAEVSAVNPVIALK